METSTAELTHNQQIKLIRDAYMRLERAFEITHDWDRYIEIQKEETDGHDRFRSGPRGISKRTEIEYFAVRQFITELYADKAPDVADFFWVKKSIYAAHALAFSPHYESNRARLTIEDRDLMSQVSNFDYCDLIAVGRMHKDDSLR